jgi:hypothetical protein
VEFFAHPGNKEIRVEVSSWQNVQAVRGQGTVDGSSGMKSFESLDEGASQTGWVLPYGRPMLSQKGLERPASGAFRAADVIEFSHGDGDKASSGLDD